VNPDGGLVEDQWWSQGCLFRHDAAYREELRLYQFSLLSDDVRDGKVGTELEVYYFPRTDGDCMNGSKENKSTEIINEFFLGKRKGEGKHAH